MTDKNLLRSAMVAKGFTSESIAELLGISRQSFSYKLNSKRPFTSNEISIMSHVLKLTPAQLVEIFFAKRVEEKSTES